MGRKAHFDRVKLQVPMDKKVYQGLEKRAEELGFDSIQAYVRFWAKAEANGHASSTYQDLKQPEVQAMRYLELLLATRNSPFASTQTALDYVVEQINQTKGLKYLSELLKRES